jgi:hypothetical protein
VKDRLRGNLWPLLLPVILWSAFALPLGRLGRSFWLDEASSVWFARLPAITLLARLCDPHPPGYYLLLKAWSIEGKTETWLRWPSLFAAVLAVALTYRLGKTLCSEACAGWAALLVAVHPLQSWYATEARMYAPVQAAGLLAFWSGSHLLGLEAGDKFKRCLVVIYGLSAIIAVGLDYSAFLPLGLLQLFWLGRGRPHWRSWLILQGLVLLLAVLLWVKPSQIQALDHSYHVVFVAILATRLGLALTPAEAGHWLTVIVVGLGLAASLLAWFWPKQPQRWLAPLTE